ncbi:hypothetical protein WDW86_08355 [Bdellovibrionota bacterium FG-2]
MSRILTAEEFVIFKNFYQFFQPSYSKLLERIAKFYKVRAKIDYQIVFVWWPPIDRTNASPTGKFLVMRYHPQKHIKDALADGDVVFHEVVHTISAKQDLEKKRELTKAFLNKCPIQDKMKQGKILEEPLAVAIGQIYYMRRFEPKNFRYSSSLYNDPWISLFGRVLYPLVEEVFNRERPIDNDFVLSASKLCNEVVAVTMKLQPPVK